MTPPSKNWFRKNVYLERDQSISAGSIDFIRADCRSVCTVCSKEYWRHPKAGPVGYDGEQFLRMICDVGLVKL